MRVGRTSWHKSYPKGPPLSPFRTSSTSPSYVMALQNKVILFGDQTVEPCPLIKQLWRSSSHSTTLQTFFEKTADGLRRELALAQVSDRSNFPCFHSILSLVETYTQSHEPDEAVATVLLCVYQLALLLTYELQCNDLSTAANACVASRREDNDELIFDTRSSTRTYLVGLCTGMLPAAALAAASSTSQLLRLAPDIVRMALRLGLEVRRRSDQIERTSESWATVVPGTPPQEQQKALDQFHEETVSHPNPLKILFDAEKMSAIVDCRKQKSLHQCQNRGERNHQRPSFDCGILVFIFRAIQACPQDQTPYYSSVPRIPPWSSRRQRDTRIIG